MVLVMHMLFMFFVFFKNLKPSFSGDKMPLMFSLKTPPKWFELFQLTQKVRIKLKGSTKTLNFPLQCNGNC